MKNQELLKQLYEIVDGKDMIEQDDWSALQEIVGNEIINEAEQGNIKIKRYSNGYIHQIEIP